MITPISADPRKKPIQRRSRALVSALTKAAARVLSRRSLDRATTNEIADLAGVSIGSLYQYFPNKQALVAALIRSRASEDVVHLTKFMDLPLEVPLEEAMRQGARALVDLHRRSPHLYRVLLRAVPELGQYEAVRGLARAGRRRFADFLRTRRHETRALDAELSALVLGRSIEAVLHHVILEEPELLEDPRLVEELTTLCVRYLGCREPSRS